MRRSLRWMALMSSVALVVTMAAGCGGGGGKSSKSKGHRGGTFTILAHTAPSGGPDPAINYTLQYWQLLIDTHDGLVAFKRSGGKEGTKIVPDLATSIPKPTGGGKTWTFKLRRNIKYSNGTVMKPSDFKRTFERMFVVKGPTAGTFYKVFIGADKCLKPGAKTCDLSQAIVPDDKNYTLTFHLTGSDPEFLDKLGVPFAFALPPSTPQKEVAIAPPGTGPYKFVTYSPRQEIKLVRNPFFKEWSKDAQPNGNPDTIVEKIGLTVEAEVTQIENGQADALSGADQVPADRLPELSSKYSSLVHVNPLTAVWYMAFNVRVPPFNNLKARQGVNFATDHNALVKIYGGPKLAQPTCQILPPNFPGYKPYCPYTKSPGSKWSAPDLAKAQQLINASGTKGAAVKVNTDTNEVDKAIGLYFVGLLNKLGYKAQLQALSTDIQYTFCQNSKNKVQFCFSSWYQDYPAASDFLNVLLGCGSYVPNSDASPNISEYCDPSTQAKMDQALKLGFTDQAKANTIWTQVDKQVVDNAVWVPLFNPKFVDLLGKRVKGYLFSPQWYFLIDQASVQ